MQFLFTINGKIDEKLINRVKISSTYTSGPEVMCTQFRHCAFFGTDKQTNINRFTNIQEDTKMRFRKKRVWKLKVIRTVGLGKYYFKLRTKKV